MTLSGRLKDAAAAAVVTLILAVPLVGLRTVDQGGVLGIETRWDWVLIGVLVVVAGRLAMGALGGAWSAASARVARALPSGSVIGWLAPAAIGFAIALPFLPFADRYVIDVGTTLLIYVMLGWGLNVVVGLAGLLDLGYVAFYAVGAYAYALLAVNAGVS